MNILLKSCLLFLSLNLLYSCGNHKSTVNTGEASIDTTSTAEDWNVEEASFGEDEMLADTKKGSLFIKNHPNIKTILLFAGNSEMNAPFLALDSDEQLTLSFDLLEANALDLNYRIVHCDARWNVSDINLTDFTDGINNTPITQIASSFNTAVNYINYQTRIPDDYSNILLSGNYLVQVFETGKEDQILFQAPFYVIEQQVSISPSMIAPRINDAKNYMQNVNFTIQHPGVVIDNPYDDIYVVIKQNQQQYLVKENIQPVFIRNNELVYNYDEATYFEGGNEFRFFDLKSLNYQTREVETISFDGSMNHAYLTISLKRSFSQYTSQPDINGRFLIKNDEGQNPYTDADYLMTHFSLKFDYDFPRATIYVAGGLSQNQLLPDFAMTYNKDKRRYEADILLKQGYYNYQFVTQYHQDNKVELAYMEGSHQQTENDYSVLVYFKNRTLQTHQLIGYQRFNSVK